MEPRRIVSLEAEDRTRALARLPLFAGSSQRTLEEVAEHARLVAFPAGRVIVPEGEEGLGFYLVLSGRVRVERAGERIAMLGVGDFFGEASLLSHLPRSATVVAESDATCLGILRSHFKPLLVRNPRLALRILEEEAQRAGSVSPEEPGAVARADRGRFNADGG